ncbi:PQQ-binding-like beta-propeller repeat protein [Deinococcus actinosclerus]|nr:PQQ-binding-like beta-propeller repeat protein [Deinococcus actinosclerus]
MTLAGISAASAQSAPSPVPQFTAPKVDIFKELRVISGVTVSGNGELTFVGSDAKIHRTDSKGSEKWAFPVGDIGRAYPVVTPQGVTIAASYDDTVYALDPGGKLLWKQKLDGDIFATPALRIDGSVIVATAGGTIHALSAAGKPLWTYKVGAPVFSSPAIGPDGTIYFGAQNNRMHALTPGGQLKWTYAAGSLVFSSPAVGPDGSVYFGSSDRRIHAVAPDGKPRWTLLTGLFVNASPIITSGGLVVVGSYDGSVYAVNTSGETEWTYRAGAGIAGSAVELSDGSVLVPDLSGTVHAIGKAGQALWQIKTGKKIDTGLSVSDQGSLYFVTDGGGLNIVQKQRPLAVGPWTTFHGAPNPVGRVPTPVELQAQTQARREAASAVLAALKPSTAATTAPAHPAQPAQPSQPAPTTQPTQPAQPAPVPALTPAQYAAAAGQKARVADGQLFLPLTEVAGALRLDVGNVTVRTATVRVQGQALPITVRTFDRAAFVPLAALSDLPGASARLTRTPAAGVTLSLGGQTALFPVNLTRLLSLQSGPEFASGTVR